MLTLDKFELASEVVKNVTKPTKLVYSEYLSQQTGGKVYLKPENMQHTGAYKLRGAYYKISQLTEEERMKEELLKRISGDNKKQQWFARKCRIHSQIRNALLKGKKEYHYLAKDEKIIELYIKENGNVMKFIKEEE